MLMTSGFVGSIACPAHQILHRNDSTKLHISEGGSLEWECSTITGAVCPSWEMTSLSEEEFTLPPAFWVHSFLFSFPGRLANFGINPIQKSDGLRAGNHTNSEENQVGPCLHLCMCRANLYQQIKVLIAARLRCIFHPTNGGSICSKT